MVISQGDVCWADVGPRLGSSPALRRPVVVVQGDTFNRSRIATVVCVAITSNLKWAKAPGNVLIQAATSGLPVDSVANVSQIATVDKRQLSKRVGRLKQLQLVFAGIDLVLPR